jgi:hypothetical protein
MIRTKAITASLLILAAASLAATPVMARNTQYMFKIADALNDPSFAGQLPTDVTFYFAQQQPPKPGTSLGEVEVELKRKKPGKTDEVNCRTALMSVLGELRDKAVAAGGNAVGGLGAVEIHRELMTAEHSRIIAAKL